MSDKKVTARFDLCHCSSEEKVEQQKKKKQRLDEKRAVKARRKQKQKKYSRNKKKEQPRDPRPKIKKTYSLKSIYANISAALSIGTGAKKQKSKKYIIDKLNQLIEKVCLNINDITNAGHAARFIYSIFSKSSFSKDNGYKENCNKLEKLVLSMIGRYVF